MCDSSLLMLWTTIAAVIACLLIGNTVGNVCVEEYSSCSKCIQLHPSCAWCAQTNIRQPCNTVSELRRHGCPFQNVVFPESKTSVRGDKNWSAVIGSSGQRTAIRPQKIDINLRRGDTHTFDMKYRVDEHLYVDLYFLMDLTYTMRDDKETLVKLGHTLAETLSSSTAKYRLGFGSFVDKPLMPYISTVPKAIKNPCVILPGNQECKSPYGFINHLSLSPNISQFMDEVRKARVSGNLDDTEGVLDGLMQAVVCKEEINWTDDSKRVVILATDNIFHYAGDGKLAGVVHRNDMKCHLDTKGFYTHSTILDYPSISQIDHVLLKTRTSVVFAPTQSAARAYQSMVETFESDARVSILENDLSNIVQILKNEFKRYQSHVRFLSNETEDFGLQFFTDCGNGTVMKRSSCDNLVAGQEVTFKVKLTANRNTNLNNQIIQINPAGINQQLIINVSLLNCDCESMVDPDSINSDLCSRNGNMTCGRCYCNSSWYGPDCRCNSDQDSNLYKLEDSCYAENSDIPCSGRGVCICGECDCRENPLGYRYNGTVCECDNNACLRSPDGEICGGFSRGECICGACHCQPGWSGDDCSCTTDVTSCMAKDGVNTQLCSGHGRCQCGACVCETTRYGSYSGMYCEECPTCDTHCRKLVHCLSIPGLSEPSECNILEPTIHHVDTLEEYHQRKMSLGGTKLCQMRNEKTGCEHHYTYIFLETGEVVVVASQEAECITPASIFYLALLIPLAILLFGLFGLCIYKCCIMVKDRNEYMAYQANLKGEKTMVIENYLYQSPWTKYNVPVKTEFERQPNYKEEEEPENMALLRRKKSATEYHLPCDKGHQCKIVGHTLHSHVSRDTTLQKSEIKHGTSVPKPAPNTPIIDQILLNFGSADAASSRQYSDDVFVREGETVATNYNYYHPYATPSDYDNPPPAYQEMEPVNEAVSYHSSSQSKTITNIIPNASKHAPIATIATELTGRRYDSSIQNKRSQTEGSSTDYFEARALKKNDSQTNYVTGKQDVAIDATNIYNGEFDVQAVQNQGSVIHRKRIVTKYETPLMYVEGRMQVPGNGLIEEIVPVEETVSVTKVDRSPGKQITYTTKVITIDSKEGDI